MSAVSVVDAYVSELPGETRRLGHGEWGITLPAEQGAGWPLDVGVRIADGLLRVQAFALGAEDGVNPWNFLVPPETFARLDFAILWPATNSELLWFKRHRRESPAATVGCGG